MKDNIVLLRQMKRGVHFTVTPINDIVLWRKEQEQKLLDNEAKAKIRVELVKEALGNGTIELIKNNKVSETTKAFKRHQYLINKANDEYLKTLTEIEKAPTSHPVMQRPKESIWTKIKNVAYNLLESFHK